MWVLVDQQPGISGVTKPRLSVGAATALPMVFLRTGPFGLVASVREKMVLCGMVWWFLNGGGVVVVTVLAYRSHKAFSTPMTLCQSLK